MQGNLNRPVIPLQEVHFRLFAYLKRDLFIPFATYAG